nr:ATP-binding protein [Oscillatoria sp. Prado101]
MPRRQEILDKLKHLIYPQFEEVLFRLNIEIWNIPGPIAEQTLRAIAVIKRLEQERNGAGFERLERVLADRAILAIGEEYQGREVETQVKKLLSEYTQKVFAGREAEQDDLNQFVREESSGVLLVRAPAGFGKSALLANWQETHHEDYFIAYHCFNSRSERTQSLSDAYRHLLRQLYIYYSSSHIGRGQKKQ